jgi:hypothetical protein
MAMFNTSLQNRPKTIENWKKFGAGEGQCIRFFNKNIRITITNNIHLFKVGDGEIDP